MALNAASKLKLRPLPEIIKDLRKESTYGNGIEKVALAIAEEARSKAPVATGDYQRGIKGVRWQDSLGWHAACIGTDYKTVMIEKGVTGAGAAGDINFPALHVFQRAADVVGLDTAVDVT